MKSLPLLSLTLFLGTTSLAQNYRHNHYNGPRVNDVPTFSSAPSAYQDCHDKYINTTARMYDACNFGATEALLMADHYAGGHGRREGYMKGFSWGLQQKIHMTKDDLASKQQGAAMAATLTTQLQNGLGSAIKVGTDIGTRDGKTEAITRFENALDSGTMPSRAFSIPASTHVSSYSNPFQSLVAVPKSVEDLLKDPSIASGNISYPRRDHDFFDGSGSFNTYDYYFSNGSYSYQYNSWLNSDTAFNIWMQRSWTRARYDALGKDTLIITTPAAPNAPGTPPNQPTVTTQNADLKAIFQSAFKGAYARYSSYYYSQQFYPAMDEGYIYGESVGSQVGHRLAFQTGEIEAFNANFRAEEKDAYTDAYANNYSSSFTSTYNTYATSPQLAIELTDVIGVKNEAYSEPGEQISIAFKVKNYGAVGAPLKALLTGNVVNSVPQSFKIAGLSSKVFTSSVMATIDPTLASGTNAVITLDVNGLTANTRESVSRQVTQEASNYNASALAEGSVKVTVVVKNQSPKARSSDTVKVVLTDSNGKTQTQNLGFIEANTSGVATSSAIMVMDGYSPLDLIDGKVSIKVQTFMGNSEMGSSAMTVHSNNVVADLARYFDISAQDSTKESQTRVALNRIVEILREETDSIGRKTYSDSPNGTMLHALQTNFRSRAQSASAKGMYWSLAKQIWGFRKNFTNFIGIKSSNRKYYENAVSELADGRKL